MRDKRKNQPSKNLLVVMPASLSDCVMATPTLDAIRGLYPDAKVTAVIRRQHRAVLEGLDCVDRVLTVRSRPKKKKKTKGRSKSKRRRSLIGLGRRLSKLELDTAVILPDTFKSAALAAVAGIPRRVGYERDGRGVLLTDRLIPRKHKGKFVPVAKLDYYLGIARYLGAINPPDHMRLALDPAATASVDGWLKQGGCDPERTELFLVAPGGRNPDKRWSPRRYAHLIDLMNDRFGMTAAVIAQPGEEAIVAEVLANAKSPVIDLAACPMRLSEIKSAISRARVLVTNDTGPRHIAAALGVPALTLFGPTGPEWSHTGATTEHHLAATGISIAARDDPDFAGSASIDRIRTDTAFDACSALYRRTATLPSVVGGNAS